MKKKLFCFCVSALFLIPFLAVTVRMMTALYVDSTGNSNDITHFILHARGIETIISDSVWEEKYPHEQNLPQKVAARARQIQKAITAFCTTSFPLAEDIHNLVGVYRQNVIANTLDQYGGPYEIAAEHTQAAEYVQPYVADVLAFEEFCRQEDIPFLYVGTPRDVVSYYYQNQVGRVTDSWYIYRSDAFFDQLEPQSSAVISMLRQTMSSHVYQFDESAHWSFFDSLFASGFVAQELNTRFGFSFTNELTNLQNYTDYFAPYRDNPALDLPHDQLFIPIESNSYTLYYAEDPIAKGAFADIALNPDLMSAYSPSQAYYGMARLSNSLMYTIQNHTAKQNADKKILVIGDSFDWMVVPYISQQVGEITFLHNASFSGSIRTYIQMHQPDAVIVMYNDTELYELYSDDEFDFS